MSHRACMMLAVFLVTPGLAHAAEPFDSFRIPEYRTFNWLGTLNGSGQWSHSSYSESYVGMPRHDTGRLEGSLGTTLDWTHATDPTLTQLSGAIDARGGRFSDQSEFMSPSGFLEFDERRARNALESLSLGASRWQYAGGGPLFGSVGISLSLSDQQTWDASRRRLMNSPGAVRPSLDERSTLVKTYETSIVEALGVGAGRVRDATGLYEALIFERRLAQAGMLERPLSAAARRRLGALMYTRSAYSATRDRPARDLWAAAAAILHDDGAVAGGPDPATVLRLMEPFLGSQSGTGRDGMPVSPLRRSVGTAIQIQLQDRHRRRSSHYVETYFSESGDDTLPGTRDDYARIYKATADDLDVAALLDYHRPLSMRWQLDASAGASAPARHGLSASYTATAGATWLIADRWLGSMSATHGWFDEVRTRGPTEGDRATWDFSGSLSYFVESATALSIAVRHGQSWTRGGAAGPGHAYARSTSTSIGITRRFSGRFSAPQLSLAPTPGTIDLAP